ncbi:translocation/assembly module TamB domain-containing protein [Apibacter adventoris]|uniref:Translocation and assembly module TamB C-terminal domain-containing protein n=1 Tax=Apibacter adventoris TaxID=1679466 RepID=A0A2S8AAM9_9FLAO|nr:translocation/assembly module TamB domain-containing protein [Apibacter adventoris]PQL91639.1 hypothetical protein C4S77_07495 [Apibacter adventoris]
MAKLKIKNLFFGLLKGVFYILCFILFLFTSLFVVINLPPVKEKIAQRGITFLNQQFKTQISAQKVDVDYFGNLIFYEVAVKDHHNFDFIKIKELKAFTNTLSLIKNLNDIKIDQLRLKEPVVRVITYKGEEKDNFSLFIEKFKSDKPPSKEVFKLEGRVDLINGQLSIINQNLPKIDQIWLDTQELNLKIPKVKIIDSDVYVTLDQFRFKGKRHNENYIVKQISGDIHYSDTELALKNLTLETDSSLLLGTLYFNYSKKNGFSNFSDKVLWNLDLLHNSKISGKDIRYFVKGWQTDAVMNLSSKAHGTLNNLQLSNSIFSSDKTFFSAPSLILKDLVTKDKIRSFSIITKEATLQTSYNSLRTWLPKFISVKIPQLITNFGTTNYKGDFSINKNIVSAKGYMISAIGKVEADLQLWEYSSKTPKYKGHVETFHLNLAPFTKSTTIGPITSKISFEGEGFNINQIDTRFDAQLSQLFLNGKIINNISTVGNLNRQLFKGSLNVADPHMSLEIKEGQFDFSNKRKITKFETNIHNLDLNYFTSLVDKNTILKGYINTDIQFNNIDDLIGEINLNNVTLIHNDSINYVENFQIKTTSDNGNRNFDIFSPNMIMANIYGKYKLNDVPEMLKNGVGNLLVNYRPKKRFDNQEFSFIFDVQKSLFDILMLGVDISPGTTITGNYIGKSNQLQVQLISEYIYYKNFKLISPNIFINTADTLRQFKGSMASFKINRNSFDNINLSGYKKHDSLFASTNFAYGKYKDQQTHFDLNLYQTRVGNELIFGFSPSKIDLNKGQWTLNPDFEPNEAIAHYNVITNKLTLENIQFKSEESEIKLSGDYISKNNYNFNIDLNDVELAKIIPQSILKDMSIEGIANGSAKIYKTSQEVKPLIDLNIDELKFNNKVLGNLTMAATYSANDDKYLLNARLLDSGEERFLAKGFIKNEPGKPSQLDVELIPNKMNIAPIGTFLQGIFSKFRGEATGDVHITGNLTSPVYQGMLTLSQVGFTVNFLGVDYQLTQDQDLQISDGRFFFNNIELMDTKTKTKGTVYGVLETKNFQEWGISLDFTTNNLLVLNTTAKDNDLFYGNVYASGDFSINGTTTKEIRISAKARALAGSNLTINSSSTTNATDISFIKFLPQKIKEDEEENEVKPPLGLSINAEVTADQNSVVNLIINQETGDRIEVRGDAEKLKFNLSSVGRITMEGTYTIKGDSKYYYQMFVNKDFTIVPESTIIWDGRGPTDANLNITATYSRNVSNIGEYLGTSTVPATNVIVKAILSGYLSKPKIDFDIDVDGAINVKDQLKTKLNNNEGEKLNQVAAIVMFGSFLSDNMGGSNYASSAYDIVLKQLTSVINNISGVFSLDANFNAGSRIGNTSDRISLDPTFKLNNRLSIVGSVNMPLEQKSAADVWTYGAKIDYDISKNADKSLIISGFSKPSTFGLETSVLSNSGANNQAYGGGIVYKKSFNNIKEIIGRKKKTAKEKKDSEEKKKTEEKKD